MQAAKVAAGANSLESFAQVFIIFPKYLLLVSSIWRSSSGTFDNLKSVNDFNLNDRFDLSLTIITDVRFFIVLYDFSISRGRIYN